MSMRWQVSTFGVILFTLPLREPYLNHLPYPVTFNSSKFLFYFFSFASRRRCWRALKASRIQIQIENFLK